MITASSYPRQQPLIITYRLIIQCDVTHSDARFNSNVTTKVKMPAILKPEKCQSSNYNPKMLEERNLREQKYFRVHETYKPNLRTQPITGKFYSPHEKQDLSQADEELLQQIRKCKELTPKEKYPEPVTESHRYGWIPGTLAELRRNDRRFYTPKVNSISYLWAVSGFTRKRGTWRCAYTISYILYYIYMFIKCFSKCFIQFYTINIFMVAFVVCADILMSLLALLASSHRMLQPQNKQCAGTAILLVKLNLKYFCYNWYDLYSFASYSDILNINHC